MDSLITYKTREQTSRIILHDTKTVPGQTPHLIPWLAVEARRMGLLTIGYHYVIHHDGRLSTARPADTIGSHTSGHNWDSIGVCLEGGLAAVVGSPEQPVVHQQDDNFSQAQKVSLKTLLGFLSTAYGELPIFGKSEVGRYREDPRVQQTPAINMKELRQWLTAP